MSIYSISDLHLSFGTNKSMQIFGPRWSDYENRLQNNWNEIIKNDDIVLIPGDLSWATYLEYALLDLKFLNSLNGQKIISKGNHDYWWSTLAKNRKFALENNFTSLNFIHNNAHHIDSSDLSIVIAGTRGWIHPVTMSNKNLKDIEIYQNECQRLKLSLDAAKKDKNYQKYDKIIVMLHYPPDETFHRIMMDYSVDICVFGHLHHADLSAEEVVKKLNQNNEQDNEQDKKSIDYHLVSADFLQFTPKLIL